MNGTIVVVLGFERIQKIHKNPGVFDRIVEVWTESMEFATEPDYTWTSNFTTNENQLTASFQIFNPLCITINQNARHKNTAITKRIY